MKQTSSNQTADDATGASALPTMSSSAPAMANETPPSAATMVSKLFVVPALIVCLLLGVAVVVVMFGSTSIESAESVPELLSRLESDSGDPTLEMLLMPGAKEHWQAAQSLAQRLAEKEKFIKPEELEPTAQRLIALLGKFQAGKDTDEPGPPQQYFLMMALGRLGTDSAAEALRGRLNDPNWATRRTAVQSLALMGGTATGRAALPAIYPMLEDRNTTVQVVACAAIAALAAPGDAAAVKALSSRLEGDREVQWNAATALARLGDRRGKLVLMNMLDRGYWESMDLDYIEAGTPVRRKYTDSEIANHLKTAIEAAAMMADEELHGLIRGLVDDKAVIVRDAARAAIRSRDGARSTWRDTAQAAQDMRGSAFAEVG